MSGHDFDVGETEPHVELCADIKEYAWDFLSNSLSTVSPLLKINKR